MSDDMEQKMSDLIYGGLYHQEQLAKEKAECENKEVLGIDICSEQSTKYDDTYEKGYSAGAKIAIKHERANEKREFIKQYMLNVITNPKSMVFFESPTNRSIIECAAHAWDLICNECE